MIDVSDQVTLHEAIEHLDAALEALDGAKDRISKAMHLAKDPYGRGKKTIDTIQPVRWWKDELVAQLQQLQRGTAT